MTDLDTLTYVLVFRAPALHLPDTQPCADITISHNTTLHFTRGPIEYGIFQVVTPPVTVLPGAAVDIDNADIIKALPGKAYFPAGQSYIVVEINTPSNADQDFLEREIGMVVTVGALLLGPSHFLECLDQRWIAYPRQGKIRQTIHVAETCHFDPQRFGDEYRSVNKHLSQLESGNRGRAQLMARWFAKAVRELEHTEDKFVYYWTVLEILVQGHRPMVRLFLQYLAANILVGQSAADINSALGIGRMYGTRGNLYHQGKLEWDNRERSEKFKLLRELCSEVLRHELGLPLARSLEPHMARA